jgi:hypothetical protein
MGTRSNIIVQQADGRWAKIYVHWDGYLKGVGKTLQEHYTTQEKIDQLIALGDLSVLDDEIGEKQDFEHRHPGWTLPYGRDRGEEGVETKFYPTLEAAYASGLEEYAYVWKDKHWYTTGWLGFPANPEPKLQLLVVALARVERA